MWTQSVHREFTAHVFGEAFPGAAAAVLVGQLIITAAEGSARRAAYIIVIRAFPFSCLHPLFFGSGLFTARAPWRSSSAGFFSAIGTSRNWLFWLLASGNTGVRPPNECRAVYRSNGATWDKQVWPKIRCTISYMKGKQHLRRTALLRVREVVFRRSLIKTPRTDQWSSWCEPG